MDHKLAIVTGGSSEIGHGIIESLLSQKYHVIATFANNKVRIKNKALSLHQVDFNDQNNCKKFIKTLSKLNKKIDVLINCAGYTENINFLETGHDEILKTFNVNLFGHIEIMKFVFDNMCNHRAGRIISLSSIGVKFSGSNTSVYYSASKSALEAVTKSFAKFGSPYNVLCNNLRVGVIDTKFHKNKDLKKRVSLIPLQRIGQVSDVVHIIDFLLSDRATFITGQDLAISGGE
ncbi:MAG: SDR family NAD(P)-dependent oxidoreductase [Leptospira sp.]|nr:SDR family NAD(P)-dependent oxidoreductase [Leptospira sp.]